MRTIIVGPYNPQWPAEFERIKAYLLSHIKDLATDVIHVGSTSVPGLAAKPVIDFNIIVESYDVFPELVRQLNKLGYEHEGDGGIPMRERFKRNIPDGFISYHMYVCPKNSPEHQRQILFRDYLRAHGDARDEYAGLKQTLAEKFRHDMDSYVNGKHEFVENILKKAKEKNMCGSITKSWDWSKNTDNNWFIPCADAAFLAERWQGLSFKRFLDLGCGLGRHSVYMAKKGFCVSAADLSEYGINHLKEWVARENLDVKATVCNMLELPFEDNGFDCVMAYNVIYHTDTAGFVTALSQIRRILRPGGELLITLISKNTYSFQHSDHCKRIDANTLLRDEYEAGKDVPHFYADIADIKELFSAWSFVKPPVEWCEYNMDNQDYYSKHWTLLVRKDE